MSSRTKYYISSANGVNTYLYPKSDIQRALATTQFSYTFDGTNLVFPTLTNLLETYYAIWYKTTLSIPPSGYYCGPGSMFEDMGETMQFMLENGQVIVKWRLVKQLSAGSSPVGTVGFTTIFNAYRTNIPQELELSYLIRTG